MEANTTPIAGRSRGIFRYDRDMRRLWIGGQRVHHGLTGLLMMSAGIILAAHDWKDRRVWFRRGE
jgi:hypothetical protein